MDTNTLLIILLVILLLGGGGWYAVGAGTEIFCTSVGVAECAARLEAAYGTILPARGFTKLVRG